MKKKKEQKRRPTNQNDELSRLNNEIGSFGLEPPKHYRPEQRTVQANNIAKRKATANKNAKLTNEQKHSLNAKKRKKMKKIRRVASYVFIAVCLIVAALVALIAFGFKIDTVKIENNKKYSNEQIMSVLPIEKEKSLFFIDTDKAAQKLEKSLPYIYDVQIKRKLPSTVIVTVAEPEYIFYIKNADTSYTLLDDNFKVLEANIKSKPKNSIEIKKAALEYCTLGEEAKFSDEKIQKNVLELTKAVKGYKLDEITAVYSEGITANYLVYDGRLTIKIGETDDLENKIFASLTAIEKLNDSNPSAEGIITSTGGKQVYFTENK